MRGRIALLLLHLMGNAILLGLGYWWLGMDESDTRHLLLSALLAFLVLVGATALHGLALAYFSGLPLRKAAARSLRHLLPLVMLSLLTLAIYGGLSLLARKFDRPAYVIGSSLTMALRRPVAPELVQKGFEWLLRFVEWVMVPALLLPLAAAIAVDGWRGWGLRLPAVSRRWRYWLEVAALLLCALWLPFKLFFWVPKILSFNGQVASFVARAGMGYLLFVIAALLLDFVTSAGKPRETQPSTVLSP